jgi:hypothetical protein
MTIQECLSLVKELKSNKFTDAVLVGWLSDLDQKLYNECIEWHEDTGITEPARYDPVTDLDAELIAVDPYSEMYPVYLGMKIDYAHGEYGRYNNSMVAFNTMLSTYQDYINRTYKPISRKVRVWL